MLGPKRSGVIRSGTLPTTIGTRHRLSQSLRLLLRRDGQETTGHRLDQRPQKLFDVCQRNVQVWPTLAERPPRKIFTQQPSCLG
jgi:hypothetical protein